MIRFGGRTEDGQRLIGLALAPENLRRLEAGQPIIVRGNEVGASGIIVVVLCGETSENVMREFVALARNTGASVEELNEALRTAGFDRKPKASDAPREE